MKVLVTGFEPFGGDGENASAMAVQALSARWSGPHQLVVEILPVEFDGAVTALQAAVRRHRPDLVLGVGEAGGRVAVTPERHGRNLIDARIPDNAGRQPTPGPIDGGPVLRPATLDVDDLVVRLRAEGLPAEVSEDAGGFVCNRVAVALADLEVPAAFVHVPAVRTAGAPTVGGETDGADPVRSSALTVDALARALEACVHSSIDQTTSGGLHIAALTPQDRADWDPLWAGYIEFYETTLPTAITDQSFARLSDPAGDLQGALARAADGTAVGFVHWITHPGTWKTGPVCYLEDLFVAPAGRRQGGAEQLIRHVRQWATAHGCEQLYWITRSDNATARSLYDRLATEMGYVRYEMELGQP